MQAALFDLDGTLTMSDHLHYIAWREELAACSTHKDLSQEEVCMGKCAVQQLLQRRS
jgi:beta-phosphoglucomutase-like phosphatase (HAD superfamily)